MGKIKKLNNLKMVRNAPLERQLHDDAVAKSSGRVKIRKNKQQNHDERVSISFDKLICSIDLNVISF